MRGRLGWLALALTCCTAATASAATAPNLPKIESAPTQPVAPNQVDAGPVKGGLTYQASLFPIPVRVRLSASGWHGGQGRSLPASESKPTLGPFYGWIEIYRPPTGGAPNALGDISLITAYGKTPSVGAVVAGLRTRGTGATFEQTSPVTIAGYPGQQFDGTIVGSNHHFIPFTPRSNKAQFYPDIYTFEHGEAFRVIVLGVRGKTVVIFIDSVALPADQFPAFLADDIAPLLASLRFPH